MRQRLKVSMVTSPCNAPAPVNEITMPPDDYDLLLDSVLPPRPSRAPTSPGLRPELETHWNNIQSELRSAGVNPVLRSGYRTPEQQNALHRAGKPTKGNDGYINISPHQDGRALDIGNLGVKGKQILADYARRNNLHIPSDEPWHVAIPQNQQKPKRDAYDDLLDEVIPKQTDVYDTLLNEVVPAKPVDSRAAYGARAAEARGVTKSTGLRGVPQESDIARMVTGGVQGETKAPLPPSKVPDINRILSEARTTGPQSFAEDRAMRERELAAQRTLRQRIPKPNPQDEEYRNFLLMNRAADSPAMREGFIDLQVKQQIAPHGSARAALALQNAETARQQRLSQKTAGQKIAQVPKSAVAGFAGGVGTGLKSIAVLAKKLDLFGEYEGKETTDLGAYQLGEYITNKTREVVGSDPDLGQEFLVGRAPETIGQIAQFMLGGWATKSPRLAVAVMGAGMTAGDAYDEVRANGGTDEQAVNAGLLAGGLLGPTELIGMRGAIKALEGTARAATWRATFKTALREGRRDIVENALQEVGQEFGQGVITGNPRSLKQLFEAGALGAVGGTATVPLTVAANAPMRRVPESPGVPAEPTTEQFQQAQEAFGSQLSAEQTEKPVATFRHRDLGLVTEAESQSGVPKGRLRVVAEDGSTHLIKRPNGRGQGNNLAIPVRQVPTEPTPSSSETLPVGAEGDTTPAASLPSEQKLGGDAQPSQLPVQGSERQSVESARELRKEIDQISEEMRNAAKVAYANAPDIPLTSEQQAAHQRYSDLWAQKIELESDLHFAEGGKHYTDQAENPALDTPDVDAKFHSYIRNRRPALPPQVEAVKPEIKNQVDEAKTSRDVPVESRKEYPLADRGEWYSNADYVKRGGRSETMTPDEFLAQAKPLELDEVARDNIDDLKRHIQGGRTLDPVALYADGKTDGRHRAIAAKELGINNIPVLDFRTKGETIDSTAIETGPIKPKTSSEGGAESTNQVSAPSIPDSVVMQEGLERRAPGIADTVRKTLEREQEKGQPAFAEDEFVYTRSGKHAVEIVNGREVLRKMHDTSKEGFQRALERQVGQDGKLYGSHNAKARELLEAIKAEKAKVEAEREATRLRTDAEAEALRNRQREYDARVDATPLPPGKKRAVRLANEKGAPVVDAPSTVYGDWSIRKTGGHDPYTITHVPSGRAAGDVGSVGEAKRLIKAYIESGVDTASPKLAENKDVMKRLGEIYRYMTKGGGVEPPVSVLKQISRVPQEPGLAEAQSEAEARIAEIEDEFSGKNYQGFTVDQQRRAYQAIDEIAARYGVSAENLRRTALFEPTRPKSRRAKPDPLPQIPTHPDPVVDEVSKGVVQGVAQSDLVALTDALTQLTPEERAQAQGLIPALREELSHGQEAAPDSRAVQSGSKTDSKVPEYDQSTTSRVPGEPDTAGAQEVIPPNLGPGARSIHEKAPEVKERQFGVRFTEDEQIAQDIRDSIGTAKYYEPIPNDVTAADAQRLVDERGIPQSMKAIMDEDTGIPFHVRSAMGQLVLKRLNKAYKALKTVSPSDAEFVLDQATDMAEWQMDYGTRLGQGVQSFAMWARLSPEGKLLTFKRAVDKARKNFTARNGKEVQQILKGMEDAGLGKVTAEDTAAATPAIRKALAKKAARAKKTPGDISIWQEYKDSIARQLFNQAVPKPGKPKPPLQEFTERLLANVEPLIEKPAAAKITPDVYGELREVVANFDKYQEAWNEAVQFIRSKYDTKTNAELAAMERRITDLHSAFQTKAFDKVFESAVKQAELNFNEIAKAHYESRQRSRDSLIKDIQDGLGIKLSAEDVTDLASRIEQRMETKIIAARQQILKSMEKSNKVARKVQTLTDKIVEAARVGVLNEQVFYDIASEKLGLPKYDKDVAAKIFELAGHVEDAPEGMPQDRAILNLNKYIAQQNGFTPWDLPIGIYYGNILSGYNTHIVNAVDTFLNIVSEVNGLAIQNPRAAAKVYGGMLRGFVDGRLDALMSLSEGRMVTDQKWMEAPRLMELAEFGKKGGVPIQTAGRLGRAMKAVAESKPAVILNAYKYVTRLLAASDAVMFRSAKEARASLLAYRMAEAEGLKGDVLDTRVREILALDRESDFIAQAAREGFTGNEAKVRAAELRDLIRDKDIDSDAADFAGEATYNHEPHGALGYASKVIGSWSQNYPPLKLFVPFTRIVANVTNRGLNYTPYGFKRAWKGYSNTGHTEVMTAEQRSLMITRATLGTVGLGLLWSLQAASILTIHGAGPSDRERKRQLQQAGWRPYTIQMGDVYMSYIYTPLGLGLSIIGNGSDGGRYHEMEQKDIATRMAYSVARVGSTVFSQSFLSGLSRLFNALSENPNESVTAVKQTLSGTASAMTIPALAKDVYKLFDNKAYQSNTLMEDLIRNTPFAALALKPQLNAFGEPVRVQRQRFLDVMTGDPEWRFVIEKGLRVPVPSKTSEVENADGTKRRITPEEYYQLIQTTGPQVKAWIGQNRVSLAAKSEQDAQEDLSRESAKITRAAMDRFRREIKSANYLERVPAAPSPAPLRTVPTAP